METNRPARILLAEDDESVAQMLCDRFESDGYAVEVTPSGARLLELLEQREYQLLVFDPDLPKVSGFDLLFQLRARGSRLPVLILTSGRVEDRVKSLDTGADDCVAKPFSLDELSARVRALLRRSGAGATTVLRVADLELDRLDRKARRAGRVISLTSKEFAVLECLMCHAGEPVDRAAIFEHGWGPQPKTMTNLVDVYINYLRRKVDFEPQARLIHTVRGIGYRVVSAAEGSPVGRPPSDAATLSHSS